VARIPLCPTWRSGHLRHDRFLYFVPHAGAYPGDVPVKGSQHGDALSRNVFARFQKGFERLFERIRSSYSSLLAQLVSVRLAFVPCFVIVCLLAWALVPFLGQNFFPDTDSGQFILHVRAKTGTRIEETARLVDLVEGSIRQTIPSAEMDNIIDNIGLPYSNINYTYNHSGTTGAADADILVSLKEKHHPTADYVRTLRDKLPQQYPGATFSFLPADIATQTLNFGLPAPIDIQIDGADITANARVADKMLKELSHVRGIADLRIQQQADYPKLHIDVDRTKALQVGYTRCVTLRSSPTFHRARSTTEAAILFFRSICHGRLIFGAVFGAASPLRGNRLRRVRQTWLQRG
jgi:multidrug efflux pump subunit AcrB